MLQALIGAIFGVGIFLILADCFRIPFLSTSKAANNLAKRHEHKTSSIDIWLKDLAIWISKKLRLNEYKRMQLQTDLQSAGVAMSPEMHIANSLVKSMLMGLMAVPVYFIFPLLTPLVIALAVMMYFKASKGVADKIKEKRRSIEYELPRFVAHIDKKTEAYKRRAAVGYLMHSKHERKHSREEKERVADVKSCIFPAKLGYRYSYMPERNDVCYKSCESACNKYVISEKA